MSAPTVSPLKILFPSVSQPNGSGLSAVPAEQSVNSTTITAGDVLRVFRRVEPLGYRLNRHRVRRFSTNTSRHREQLLTHSNTLSTHWNKVDPKTLCVALTRLCGIAISLNNS
jgi:hypothetical protein